MLKKYQRTRRRVRAADFERATTTFCQYLHIIWLVPDHRPTWDLLLDYVARSPDPDAPREKPRPGPLRRGADYYEDKLTPRKKSVRRIASKRRK
jgi:hypothetical protein